MPKISRAELLMLFNLPPERVVKYFQGKGYQITFDWHEMVEEAHDKAFTVAKVAKMDVLQTIRGEVDKIFTEGMTEQEFIKELKPRLKEMGWWGKANYEAGNGEKIEYTQGSTHRLKTIYRTNLSTSYAAGAYEAQVDNKESQPYLMYTTAGDSQVRHEHFLLDKTVKHIDDPFWRFFYPPNGWGCRCSVIAVSAAEAIAYGVVIDLDPSQYRIVEEPLGIDRRTGEVRMAEVVIYTNSKGQQFKTDAGWSSLPNAKYQPDLTKYDKDLVVQYDQS